ncbi:MAG: hypothetical protein EBZ36_00055 [Acidobacteria bacterium]|nr:hypothetical protein [Acidobacteriota bacterium]
MFKQTTGWITERRFLILASIAFGVAVTVLLNRLVMYSLSSWLQWVTAVVMAPVVAVRIYYLMRTRIRFGVHENYKLACLISVLLVMAGYFPLTSVRYPRLLQITATGEKNVLSCSGGVAILRVEEGQHSVGIVDIKNMGDWENLEGGTIRTRRLPSVIRQTLFTRAGESFRVVFLRNDSSGKVAVSFEGTRQLFDLYSPDKEEIEFRTLPGVPFWIRLIISITYFVIFSVIACFLLSDVIPPIHSAYIGLKEFIKSVPTRINKTDFAWKILLILCLYVLAYFIQLEWLKQLSLLSHVIVALRTGIGCGIILLVALKYNLFPDIGPDISSNSVSSEDRMFSMAWVGLGVILLIYLFAWLFFPAQFNPVTNVDANRNLTQLNQTLNWGAPFKIFNFNPYQGMGTVFDVGSPHLDPGVWLLQNSQGRPGLQLMAQVFYLLVCYASIVFLGYCLGLRGYAPILAAQWAIFSLFPPVHTVQISGAGYEYVTKADQFVLPYSLTYTALGLFALLGTRSFRSNLLILGTIPLLVLYSLHIKTLFIITSDVWLSLFALAVMVSRLDRRSLYWKFAVIVILAGLIALLRVDRLVLSTAQYMARVNFQNEVAVISPSWKHWWSRPFIMQKLDYLVLWMGMVAAAIWGRGRLRLYASVLLAGLGLLFAMSLIYSFSSIHWAYQMPNYWDWGTCGIYFIIATWGLQTLVERRLLSRRLYTIIFLVAALAVTLLSAHAIWILVAVLVPLSLQVSSTHRKGDIARTTSSLRTLALISVCLLVPLCTLRLYESRERYFIPPQKTLRTNIRYYITTQPEREYPPLLNYVRERIQLKPGGTFRGSVTGVFQIPEDRPYYWHENQGSYYTVIPERFKHTFFFLDFHELQMPSLEEYSQYVTPPLHVVVSRLLTRPQDYSISNMEIITRINPRIMRGLGVRYIYTDQKLNDRHLVLIKGLPYHEPTSTLEGEGLQLTRISKTVERDPSMMLRLYEVVAPNLAGFSPRQVRYNPTAEAALETLLEDSFEWDQQIVLHEPIKSDSEAVTQALAGAANGALRYDRDGIHIDATSEGTSLLLLPLQYSRCLVWRPAESSSVQARLLRANLLQTAVLFHGRAQGTIAFEFSFGVKNNCRRLDIADMEAMRFGELRPKGLYEYK